MRNNNNKIVALAALLVVVVGLGIGFAAYSSSLTISTSADVNPENTFKVEFSKAKNSASTGTLTGTTTLTTEASAAQLIDGVIIPMTGVSGTSILSESSISNLVVNFTDPGQQVSFTYYIRNTGEYTAYLNSVVFENLQGKSVKKECVAGTGATDSLVQAACAGISVKVYVAGIAGSSAAPIADDATPGTTLSKSANVLGKVIVTYEYGSARADGPFTVNFGDIKFNFSSAA